MAKRRQKKRTHAQITPEQERDIPKSMVIRVGQTSLANHSLNQLVKDFRQIMQPHTAVKLKERKSNKLKDFVVMCGPLGVTHLFMFTQSEKTGNVSLKIARTPQGPTVTFQVLDYSLGRDIKKFLKRPKSLNNDDVLNPPLLVLNGFSTSKRSGEDDQDVNVEKVIVSMFQNIFPPLNPARTSLNSIKLPNLHRKEDISSLILDHDLGAYTSESEIEDDAIVRVVDNQDVKAKHSQSLKSQRTPVEKKDNKEREKETEEEDVEMEEPKPSENLQPTPRKKAIKLTELGPRLTLKLVKIEEGICSGKVLHHEFVQKSSEEIKALEKRHAAKMRLKEQRKKEQEENIAKKKAVKDAKKQRKLERRKARAEEQGEGQGKDGAMSDDGSSSSEDEHYSDVPEDLDSDLFSEVE
ncbi:AAB_G0011760.mRNA.1.CDS.1 [Saccharomyces cerevisiae]|nr:AAB_G0011760.mRNA.1.CDS.1 [Saccharomyces cerevisiae]